MILARGQLYEHSCQEEILQRMGSEIDAARTQKSLPADTVVAALDALARQIETGSFARRALALGITAQQLAQAVCMLRRESGPRWRRPLPGAALCALRARVPCRTPCAGKHTMVNIRCAAMCAW